MIEFSSSSDNVLNGDGGCFVKAGNLAGDRPASERLGMFDNLEQFNERPSKRHKTGNRHKLSREVRQGKLAESAYRVPKMLRAELLCRNIYLPVFDLSGANLGLPAGHVGMEGNHRRNLQGVSAVSFLLFPRFCGSPRGRVRGACNCGDRSHGLGPPGGFLARHALSLDDVGHEAEERRKRHGRPEFDPNSHSHACNTLNRGARAA